MPLTKRQRDRILVQFYGAQDHYERLATEFRRLLDEESPFLADALYTVKYRLKDTDRLLQKIDQANTRLRKAQEPIGPDNFQQRVEDLLGFRIVCLRLSDLAKLQRYLNDLKDDDKIKIVKGPVEKKTFLITPGDPDSAGDLQYSGYSSVHYVVKLGKEARPTEQLAPLKIEVQLRTILEEAWGEIDHKYRYELKRSGKNVPPHVDAGFRDLALYLQAAARQVEHLCEDIARLASEPKKPRQKKSANVASPIATQFERVEAPSTPAVTTAESPASAAATHPIAAIFKKLLGFEPTARAINHFQRRIDEYGFFTGQRFGYQEFERALDGDTFQRFNDIYREVMNRAPFQNHEGPNRDVDVIPLVNFALFSLTRSKEAAEAGLKASLRKRLLFKGF